MPNMNYLWTNRG